MPDIDMSRPKYQVQKPTKQLRCQALNQNHNKNVNPAKTITVAQICTNELRYYVLYSKRFMSMSKEEDPKL